MNYLAHITLSCNDNDLLIGNFIADSISAKQRSTYSSAIQKGIALHLSIDTFMDEHPAVLTTMRKLYPAHSKYAPVLIDIFFDYALVQNWSKVMNVPLQDFCNDIYRRLLAQKDLMPDTLAKRLPFMIEDNWLVEYGNYEGLDRVFKRMKTYVGYPNLLEGAVDSLKGLEDEINQTFLQFFPEIQAHVKAFCAC